MAIKDINSNNTPLLQFGQKLPSEDTLAIDWLFQYRGQLKIIATEFHVGVHYATRPEHFLPIIDHLEALHKNHYVHGDIRAYNMVLNYDNPNRNHFGKLIDFDYGGEVETIENANVYPRYPSGYVLNLDDGLREGHPGEDITFEHDWRALGSVILELYSLAQGSIATDAHQIELKFKQRNQLDRMRDAFLNWDKSLFIERMQQAFLLLGEECTIFPSENPCSFLREYLILAQRNKFELRANKKFQRNLEECNMLKSGKPRIDSKGATGSPTTR